MIDMKVFSRLIERSRKEKSKTIKKKKENIMSEINNIDFS